MLSYYIYRLQKPYNDLRTYEICEIEGIDNDKYFEMKNLIKELQNPEHLVSRRLCEGFWGQELQVKHIVDLMNKYVEEYLVITNQDTGPK